MRRLSILLFGFCGLRALLLGQSGFAERKVAVPKEGPQVISLFNTATTANVNPATDYLFLYSAAAGADRKALVSDVFGGAGGAHAFLSATHSDTTAGTVLRGDWIAGVGATPKWERKAKCANSEFIGGDGTDMLCLNISVARDFGGVALQATSPGTQQGSGGNKNFNLNGVGILQKDSLAATFIPALILQNPTASTAGTTVQNSPGLQLIGHSWESDAAVDQVTSWLILNEPVTSTNPSPRLHFKANEAGGAFTTWMRLDTANGSPFLAIVDAEGYILPSGTSNASLACTSSTECGVYGTLGPPGGQGLQRWAASSYLANLSTKTGNYTTTTLDSVLIADTTSGSITFTLVACTSAMNGLRQSFIKTAAANTMTLDGNASELVNGATTLARTGQYSSVEIVCVGASTQWFTISQNGS